MIIALLAVLGIGIVSVPMIMDSDPVPVASSTNKPIGTNSNVKTSSTPIARSKFLADVEKLRLTEYFNSITEKFKEFAKSK